MDNFWFLKRERGNTRKRETERLNFNQTDYCDATSFKNLSDYFFCFTFLLKENYMTKLTEIDLTKDQIDLIEKIFEYIEKIYKLMKDFDEKHDIKTIDA